jgi:Domain of unknown function (DUF4398)
MSVDMRMTVQRRTHGGGIRNAVRALPGLGAACLSLVCLACGASVPPRPLIDARKAYDEARLSRAAELAPAELHVAKVSLNAAEQAFQDDAESYETYTLSYVALRTAELVKVQAETKQYKADLDQAQRELDRLETEEITKARSELNRAHSELACPMRYKRWLRPPP